MRDHHMSDASLPPVEAQLRQLIGMWQEKHSVARRFADQNGDAYSAGHGDAYRDCADELEQALAAAIPSPQTWQPLEDEIQKGLDWISRESFGVDYDTIGRKSGGIGTVVEHSTAMHAILFIRKALHEAVASLRGGPAKE